MSAPAVAPEKALPRELPKPLLMGCVAMVGIGVVAFLFGLASDAQSAWLAFHANLVYFTMMAGGGLALSAIYTTVGARWCGPYKRFAEGLGAFLPVAFVLSLVGFFGRDHIFEWVSHPAAGKEVWLNTARVYGTDFAILGVLAALSIVYLRRSARPTLKNLAESGGASPRARPRAGPLAGRAATKNAPPFSRTRPASPSLFSWSTASA